MLGRFIFLLAILLAVLVFGGVNFKNTSDISLLFYTFKSVPIFISLILTFILGAVLGIVFTSLSSGKKKKSVKNTKAEKLEETADTEKLKKKSNKLYKE